MRLWVLLAALCLLPSCDDAPSETSMDAGVDTAAPTVTDDLGPVTSVRSCLDRPSALLRAPVSELPCELFPPGR
jgi:hypothetical protein